MAAFCGRSDILSQPRLSVQVLLAAGKGDISMPKAVPVLFLVLALALIVAGGFTIGIAQTITLLAIAATFIVFYLIVAVSRA